MKQQMLKAALEAIPQADYPFESRVHRLRSFPGSCFVKRDDELSFGVSGSKMRKFRTLIPNLIQDGVDSAIVIGGSHSNNVVGLVQLLLENGIEPILFLREAANEVIQGNRFFIRLLAGRDSIRWIARERWEQVNQEASHYAGMLNNQGKKTTVIPEGSMMSAAFYGALTLGLDCMRNESALNLNFDHIFVDAGTGMTAIALLLVYTWMQKKATIHVVLLADEAAQFQEKLIYWHGYFSRWINHDFPIPSNYVVRTPATARSFGTVNNIVLDTVSQMASVEGILTDPIYTAKLFHTAKHALETEHLSGNSLVIHSGGGLALSGFQTRKWHEG